MLHTVAGQIILGGFVVSVVVAIPVWLLVWGGSLKPTPKLPFQRACPPEEASIAGTNRGNKINPFSHHGS